MRVILVDDEPLVLAYIEKLLCEIDGFDIIGKYSNPYHAVEAIIHRKPDAVFLDVEMPGLNGIEVAEQIQNWLPKIKVVFITAHSEYAVNAFDLNAVDYLLKPVRRERLLETINRLIKQQTVLTEPNFPLMVCCFQNLHFKRTDGQSIEPEPRWRTNKVRELFTFLIHHRENPVRKDVIHDQLWPETDWERGFTQIYTAIYQIRKTLESIGCDIKITSQGNSYQLDLNGIKLDVEEWEEKVATAPPVSEETIELHWELIKLYQGDYLADHDYVWAESERERLRLLWLNHATKVVNHFISNEDYLKGITLYHRIQEYFPSVEKSYFMLMQLYDRLGDRYAVEQQYEKMKRMLTEEYDLKPSKNIEVWYQKWKTASKKE